MQTALQLGLRYPFLFCNATQNRALVLALISPADLLQALEEWRPTHIEKWLSRETR